ncbi:MAG: imidazole glycerol phosphate synthase subunit HisH [Bacteroidota bacterium]
MKIAIIDYGAGNVQSVKYALERLGYNSVITDSAEVIKNAEKVIFPGVGEAGSAMKALREKRLDKTISELKQPVLGVCLGMQLMCKSSEEGNTKGLGIIDLAVKKFPIGQKVPQIGWNQIENLSSPLFQGISEKEYMYLVHSYYVPKSELTIATSNYSLEYATAIRKDNFYGVQFHPEKSSVAGEKLLHNFLKIKNT